MINKEDVKALLIVIGDYDSEQIQKYQQLLENAISIVGKMADESDHADSRIVYLAAAKANYDIKLIESCSGSVSSFTAGDVSITENANAVDNSKQLLNSAIADASTLIIDKGFAFLGV